MSTTFRLDLLVSVSADFGLSELAERTASGERLFWVKRLNTLLDSMTHSSTEMRRVLCIPLIEQDRNRSQLTVDPEFIERIRTNYYETLPEDRQLAVVMSHVSGQSHGGKDAEQISGFCRWLLSLTNVPPVAEVSAFRQISSGDSANFSGSGLIRRLAELENPPSHDVYEQNIARFEGINRFVQSVIGDDSARIRVTSGQDDILVVTTDRVLPLASLGTGIHEVVILALAATLLSKHLICMEEPEIHMHPVMQRRLLTYLAETDNRYLIATHSAALLDQSLGSISHIKMSRNGSRLTASATSQDVSHLVSDLGYRASDIVQANSVLWVEGPSDRNYLRFWLTVVDPDLIEGVHYSIMFYGGALLSHLTAEDAGVKDFIALRKLNRNSVILIDSDRTSEEKEVNATKKRVRREFNDDNSAGFAWVTWGYTIENYVPRHLMEAAIKSVHPRTKYTFRAGRFANPLASARFSNKTFSPDKTAISAAVVENWLPADPLPDTLLTDVRRLSKVIRAANGIDPKVFVGRPRK
ncbi:AAA family ATPase [Microbacterium sp. KSW-18]|uniref:AAA family ATPase n=1 Tax=Microbacterium aquilitoris TaxID=3067307 RepID=A0ABU3GHP3_9MICO|nr:AAA family ATPase [Microbacterium sp. KSW-18]MDT3330220.1 AAA family ATPase [Microbacterium sp. KSW-18]